MPELQVATEDWLSDIADTLDSEELLHGPKKSPRFAHFAVQRRECQKSCSNYAANVETCWDGNAVVVLCWGPKIWNLHCYFSAIVAMVRLAVFSQSTAVGPAQERRRATDCDGPSEISLETGNPRNDETLQWTTGPICHHWPFVWSDST